MSKCRKCTIELGEFNSTVHKKGICKKCISLYRKDYEQSIKFKVASQCCKCKATLTDFNRSKGARAKCKSCVNDYANKYRKTKPEVAKAALKKHRTSDKRKVSNKRYNSKYRLAVILRSRLNSALKARNLKKTKSFRDYIGCSIAELKQHLQAQFQPGMTWDNHSMNGWHIDHIIPLCSAKNDNDIIKLCHYSNLQPLWAADNLQKSGRH